MEAFVIFCVTVVCVSAYFMTSWWADDRKRLQKITRMSDGDRVDFLLEELREKKRKNPVDSISAYVWQVDEEQLEKERYEIYLKNLWRFC